MISASISSIPIPATIDLATAKCRAWDVIVVGGGPAGASTAIRLGASGLSVLLIDRHPMPRRKVCGCCLSPSARRELDSLAAVQGATEITLLPRAPLNSVRLVAHRRNVSLPLPSGGVVSREVLDVTLVRVAIAVGCHWLPAVQALKLDDSSAIGRVVVQVNSLDESRVPRRHALTAAYAVMATGISDRIRVGRHDRANPTSRSIVPGSRIGMGTTLPRSSLDLAKGELLMAIDDDGYCGLVHLEDGRIDLAAAADRMAVARHGGPAAAVAAIVERASGGLFDTRPTTDAIHAASFQATPSLSRMASLTDGSSGRILRVGDAAAYVEPFTGEGIGWALAGGRLLAHALMKSRPALSASLADPCHVADTYRRVHQRHFLSRYRRCRTVAQFVRQTWAVSTVIVAAKHLPWMAGRLVPMAIGTGDAVS